MPKQRRNIPRPVVRISPPHELERFLRKMPIQKKLRLKRALSPKRVYRSYSDAHRLLVVGLRYGSDTDFTNI